ncbi:hypothetical protein [Microlunatus ginsengisoli]|uniref:Secreted protein n=1 Tax=Microlunatus ginsengisoli TaxID=363863 RepID=A0ABP6ZLP2_9ACTN
MDPWTVGIVVVIAVGVVVIVLGALSDRRKNRRAAREMLSPPDRPIPRFAPETPAPHYLSELQARRRPGGARTTELSAADRDELARRLRDPDTVSLPAGMVSPDFITDRTAGWAVLDRPYVLVCAEPITTVRELITPLEKVLPTGRPVVVVAPGLAGDVRSTLEVNAIQQTMSVLAVEAAGDVLTRIAGLVDTTPIPRADLQSSWVGLDRLGGCDRWVSTATTSYLLDRPDVA